MGRGLWSIFLNPNKISNRIANCSYLLPSTLSTVCTSLPNAIHIKLVSLWLCRCLIFKLCFELCKLQNLVKRLEHRISVHLRHIWRTCSVIDYDGWMGYEHTTHGNEENLFGSNVNWNMLNHYHDHHNLIYYSN